MIRSQRPRRASWATAAAAGISLVAAVGLGLTGCAADPGLSASASESLQNGVVSVANQAAAGDNATALASLDALQQQLQGAIDSGDITAERAATVQQAIDLVRADLQSPSNEQTPAPEETSEPSEPATPETETPETNIPETVTPETSAPETSAPETVAPEPVAPGVTDPAVPNAPGNNGNGNGNNGNGNGNGNKANGNGKAPK